MKEGAVGKMIATRSHPKLHQSRSGAPGTPVRLRPWQVLLLLAHVHEGDPAVGERRGGERLGQVGKLRLRCRWPLHARSSAARRATRFAKSATVLTRAESSSVSLMRKRSSNPTARMVNPRESSCKSRISSSLASTGRSSSSSCLAIRRISSITCCELGATVKPGKKSRAIGEGLGVNASPGGLFGADPRREEHGVAEGKKDRGHPGAVNQGYADDFQSDRGVVGMPHETIGPAGDRLLARDNDDPHVPARAQRGNCPVSQGLRGQGAEQGDDADRARERPARESNLRGARGEEGCVKECHRRKV